MRIGPRAVVTAVLAVFSFVLALPAAAAATLVGLSATATEPSECFAPQQNAYASTSCQVFYGSPLEMFALASRDDGSVRLEPQPFTIVALGAGGPAPVASFTNFDDNDADDRPVVVPARSTDYQSQFGGNQTMAPGTSATMVVEVGARLTIPPDSSSGPGTAVRVPARVVIPSKALRGRVELRRCHRTKAHSAASCARRSSYTVLARRPADSTRQVRFPISAPPRSMGRYEIVFRPRSKGFAATRQAFQVINGFDGLVTYRPTVRRSPFGNR